MEFKTPLITRAIQEVIRDRRVWISLLMAVNLINLPNLLACVVPCFAWFSIKLWLFSVALTLLVCAFGLRVRLMLWLALPLLLLVPACIACLVSIENLPTTFLILALLETNPSELSAFQGQVIYVGAGMVLLVCLYVWFVKNRVPVDYRLGPVGRALVLLTLCVPAIYDLVSQGQVVCVARLKQQCLSTFPCSTLYGAYEAFDMRARVQNRQDLTEQLVIGQEPEFRDETQRQVHMLVIGESASKSCFSLYGYERPTTPMLEHTDGVLPFRDVASAATVTLVAVPALLTPAPAGQILEATREASILSAYNKAGFRVYWLSTQRKHGTYDTLTSLYSADAHEAVFNGGTFDVDGVGAYTGATDVSLLPLVRGILKRNEPKVLLVLHTIGSHGPYPARYSSMLARFPAEKQATMDALMRISAGKTNAHDLELAQNSYDNSICATDFLLANLINDLKQINASSWMCYLSDHGENTSKALLGKFMHGTVTRQVVEIPMVMWVSPLYEQAHAGRVSALKANLNTPFSSSCTFHTLLDMGGLSCAGFKKEWSSASPNFTPGARLVCDPSGGISDYDKKFPHRKDIAQMPVPQEKATHLAEGEPKR